jgi:DNA polymerase I-like protein with 3'-5' exonuclease and polymerase domains
MRILAHMSQDPYLLEFFRNAQDIHKLIAGRWLGKKPEDVTSSERENAKRVVYGILYGMGPHALSGIINVSLTEASKFIDTFLGKVQVCVTLC